MHRFAWRFVVFAGVSTTACSLVIDANVHDPVAIAGGDAATPSPDGAPLGDAGGTADAALDGASPDGAPATLSRGCAFTPAPRFCEDFESGSNLAASWDLQNSGSTVDYDPLAFAGTRGARAAMTNAPSCSFARMDKNWENTQAKSVVETHFKVRPSSAAKSADGEVAVVAFQLDKPASSDRCAAILLVAPNEMTVVLQNTGASDVRRTIGGTIPFDAWSEIGMKYVAGSSTSLVVTHQIEGGPIVETTLATPCPVLGGAVRLGLGLHCETGTAEARYDDVWLDWR